MTATTPAFDIAGTMRTVLLALLPGTATAIVLLGIGVAVNILLAVFFTLAFEAFALWMRAASTRDSDAIHPLTKGEPRRISRTRSNLQVREILRSLGFGSLRRSTDCIHAVVRERPPLSKGAMHDGSAVVTALLIALALPPLAAWWIVLLACAVAILIGKHAGGGLGKNIFNPAMSGYALVLLLFPAQLAHWPQPAFDGVTMATALDSFKQNHALTVDAWWQSHQQFGQWGAAGFEWVNLAFLGGGLFLLQRKIIGWHIPVALLAALGLCAAMYYDNGSSASGGSPLFHWLSGATMLGAFFVATDPATAAGTARGKLAYGALIGILIFAIRHWGAYPDGVAFAVLFANGVSLLLDRLDGIDSARLFRQASRSDPNDAG